MTSEIQFDRVNSGGNKAKICMYAVNKAENEIHVENLQLLKSCIFHTGKFFPNKMNKTKIRSQNFIYIYFSCLVIF